MWTLSLTWFLFTLLLVALLVALHMWLVNRRAILGDATADRLDGFWRWLWAGAKRRWDVALAAVVAIAPVAWSAGLDTIIIVANLLADLLPALHGADLSKLMLADSTKAYIQLGATVFPLVRAAIAKAKGG